MLTATLNIRIMKTKALLCLLTLMLVLAGADAEAQRKKKKNKGGKEKNEKEQFELMTKFVDASKEKMLGNFEEAEALYNECIKIDSKNAASYYELANLKLMQKSNDEALVLANKALDIDPTNEWYTLFLADLHNVRYEYNLSEELFDRLIEAHPGKVEYIYELGSVQLFQNKLKEAVKTYNKIELALGVTEEISIQKQKLYLEMNDLDGAIKEVQGLIDNYPREVRYLGILAEMYNVNGMSQEALRVYEKMSEKDPNDPRVQLSMAEHYKSLGKYDESYEYLKDAFSNSKLGIDPKIKVLLSYFEISETELKLKTQAYELLDILTDQHSEDPKAHAMKADFLYRDRRLEEAQKSFIKTVELDSSRFMVWSQLTQVDYELGDNEALLRDSETASELFPNQSIFYLFRGLAFNEAKRTDEAVEVLEAGKAFANRQPEVKVQMLSILGNVYNDTKEFEKSDKAFDNALELSPNDVLILNNYAYYLSVRNENLEDAASMSKKSNMLDPGNPSYEDTYAWILYRQEKFEDGLEWINKALDHGGVKSGVIVEHLGDILIALGRTEEALEAWETAKVLGDVTESIDDKIARVKP